MLPANLLLGTLQHDNPLPVCEHPSAKDAIKQNRMVAKLDEIASTPVCVFNGSLWTGSRIASTVQRMHDFSGRRYFRIDLDPTVVMSAEAKWHENGIIGWTSNVDHVGHFIGETLGPVYNTFSNFNISGAWIVLGGAQSYTHLTEEHTLFTWLLTLMPTHPDVFVARTMNGVKPGESAPISNHYPPSRVFDANTGLSKPLQRPHCFRCPWIQSPSHGLSNRFYSDMASRARKLLGICEPGRGYSLLLQRLGTRRILNVEELSDAMKTVFGLPVVITHFENKTAQEQMSLACGARVFLGVQGQGMEWAHFIDGGSSNGLVIELYWEGWPTYYTQLMQSSSLWAVGVRARRAHHHRMAKDDDVIANVTSIKRIDLSSPFTFRGSRRQKPVDIMRGSAAVRQAAALYLQP